MGKHRFASFCNSNVSKASLFLIVLSLFLCYSPLAQKSYHETDVEVYRTNVCFSIRFKFQRKLGQSPWKRVEEQDWKKEQEIENKTSEGFRGDNRDEMKREKECNIVVR